MHENMGWPPCSELTFCSSRDLRQKQAYASPFDPGETHVLENTGRVGKRATSHRQLHCIPVNVQKQAGCFPSVVLRKQLQKQQRRLASIPLLAPLIAEVSRPNWRASSTSVCLCWAKQHSRHQQVRETGWKPASLPHPGSWELGPRQHSSVAADMPGLCNKGTLSSPFSPVVILAGRPLYTEEFVIHLRGFEAAQLGVPSI